MLETIKADILKYTQKHTANKTLLETILCDVVHEHSIAIYQNAQNLAIAMRAHGASEQDILKIALLAKVTGFEHLLQLETLTRNELDGYMQNVLQETGFQKEIAMELVCAVTVSLSSVFEITVLNRETIDSASKHAYVIPANLYAEDLKEFKYVFSQDPFPQEQMKQLDMLKLDPLIEAGIAKAKFYRGYILAFTSDDENSRQSGLQLLNEAARDGDSEASAAMGDYYFTLGKASEPDSLLRAYEIYTGWGSMALTEDRKKAVVDMLNLQKFNFKIWCLSVALLFAMIAGIVIAPSTDVYAKHMFWGICCILGCLGVVGAAYFAYRKNPYKSLYHCPVALFVVWSAYMMIKFVF